MEKYTPIGKDKIYAKRELAEGKYLLRSAHDQSIYMNAFSTPWRINPGTATTSKVCPESVFSGFPETKLIISSN